MILLLKMGTLAGQILITAVILRELYHPLYRFARWRQTWAWLLAMSSLMLGLLTWNLARDIPFEEVLLLGGVSVAKLVGLVQLGRIFRSRVTLSAPTEGGTVLIDTFSTILAWDAQAVRLFGWTTDEAVGLTLMQTIIPPRDWEAHRAGMARLLATGEEGRVLARTFAVNARRKQGDEIPVTIRIASLPQGDGTLQFLGYVRELGVL